MQIVEVSNTNWIQIMLRQQHIYPDFVQQGQKTWGQISLHVLLSPLSGHQTGTKHAEERAGSSVIVTSHEWNVIHFSSDITVHVN